MSALTKVIDEVATAGRKAARVDKAVDTASAAGTARAASTVREDLRITLDDVLREQKEMNVSLGVQQEIEASKKGLSAELDKIDVKERQDILFEPTSGVDFRAQTGSAAEFRQRLHKQLSDPEYSSRAATDERASSDLVHGLVIERHVTDRRFQRELRMRMFGKRGDRNKVRAREWAGDSPYINLEDVENGTPQVFVHIDRQTDPTRVEDGFVQFEDANELGMHSGTNQAAMTATIRHPEDAMAQMQTLDDMIEELSGFTFDPAATKQQIVEAMEDYMIDRFTKGPDKKGVQAIFDDLGNFIIDDIVEGLGVDGDNIAKAKSLVKQTFSRVRTAPTASSVPHLFRGKNGLYLQDNGGFGPEEVGRQLINIFPQSADEISAILGSGNRNRGLQEFIESQGFDHVVYHNSVEDSGTVSIINWNEDLFVSLYDRRIVGDSPQGKAAAMAAFAMSSLGLAGIDEGG